MNALDRLRSDGRVTDAAERMIAAGASPAYVRRLLRELAALPAQHAARCDEDTAGERTERLTALSKRVRALARACRSDEDARRLTLLSIEDHADTWRANLLRGKATNRPSLPQLLETFADELAEQAGRGPFGFKRRRMTLQAYVVREVAARLTETGLFRRRPVADITALASAILGKDLPTETVRTLLNRHK